MRSTNSFSSGQRDNNALQFTKHFVGNKICIKVGLFVQLESPPAPGMEERTKHSTSSIEATSMAHPHSIRASLSWVLGNTHLWPIPALKTVQSGMAVMYHGVLKGQQNKNLKPQLTARDQQRYCYMNGIGFAREEYWLLPVFWNKTNPPKYLVLESKIWVLHGTGEFPRRTMVLLHSKLLQKNVLGMSQCWQLSLSVW